LYYALDKWEETGGYLVFRRSVHWCIPHVLHFDNKTGVLTHYVPPENLKYPWYSMFGFRGYIKTCDNEPCRQMNPLCMFMGAVVLLILGCNWYLSRLLTRRNHRLVQRRTEERSMDERREPL
jgi:hypothetical protein